MDLFIETPRDVTERLTRAQQREIEALRAASAAQQAEAQRLWQQQARMHQEQARLAALYRQGGSPVQGAPMSAAGVSTPAVRPASASAAGMQPAAGGSAAASRHAPASASPVGARPVAPLSQHSAGMGTSAGVQTPRAVSPAGKTGVLRPSSGVTVRPAAAVVPPAGGAGDPLSSAASDAYAAERAYEAARAKQAYALAAARVLLAVVLVPLGLFAVFLAAYALTCILNGASPDELGPLLGEALGHTASFFSQALASAGGLIGF